jgi:hypothetical protein
MRAINGFGLEESTDFIAYRYGEAVHKCPRTMLEGCVVDVLNLADNPMEPKLAIPMTPDPFRYSVPDETFERLKLVPGSGWYPLDDPIYGDA